MNERIIYKDTKADIDNEIAVLVAKGMSPEFAKTQVSDYSVLRPTGKVPIEEVARLDVPYLVKADIVFPDSSIISAGTTIRIQDFYIMAINKRFTIDDIALTESASMEQLPYRQITTADLPDRLFRNALDDSNPENHVGLNLAKAKEISHCMRRVDRDVKMEPLDKEAAFISTTTARKTAIKAEKQAILDENATMQTDIDAANDEAILRTVLSTASIS